MKTIIEKRDLELVLNPTWSNRSGWGDETLFLEKPTAAFEYAYGWYINGELVAIYCYTCPYLLYKGRDKNIFVHRWYKTFLNIDVSFIIDNNENIKIQYFIHNRYGEQIIDDLRISQ